VVRPHPRQVRTAPAPTPGPFLYPDRMAIRPETMRHAHAAFTGLWLVLWVTATFTGWIQSVSFVSHMSMAALVYTSAAAWQGARAEDKADDGT
jgi:hypothetical protein